MVELNCTCAHCGAGFVAHQKNKIYCSRKCNHAAWIQRSPDASTKHRERQAKKAKAKKDIEPKFTRITFNVCVNCSKLFVSKRAALYCCKECSPQSVDAGSKMNDLASRKCATCGKSCGYSFGRGRTYCSKSCANKSEASRDSKRASKARRRALERGATVETVKPFVVFDRDRWRCQLCGIKTPKSMRNTIKDNAPELDHIIPLSKGGAHSYLNTQCACRKCNGLKSSKPLGQMLLIG